MEPRQCRGGCNHTAMEHIAFDRGVVAGECGDSVDSCPYTVAGLRSDWLSGHSVGVLNLRANDRVDGR